ncbi:MAG: helix-turn-helix transcriptional regulator [Clostridia bacterium]|nr:helix-turn-helix transcriptional regulator [Clostridia bacterium]
MLSENIRNLRKSKGLSQEELAVKLNVVRQTVSKWEQGLSVPDADMLISLSEVFETPVSTLLGESVAAQEAEDLKAISEKLEVINLQLAQRKESRRKALHWFFIILCAVIIITFIVLALTDNAYFKLDFSDPENAVVGTLFHAFAWTFFRAAPIALIGTIAGIILTRKKR